MTSVLGRFGLVAVMAMSFTAGVLSLNPLTLDFSRWYAWQGIGAVLILLALALYGFWANLGGRPLRREEEDTPQTANPAVS
jgi:ABC-type nickel/cobalt efflux system permease component RcnA